MTDLTLSTCPPSVHLDVDMSTQSTPLWGGQVDTTGRERLIRKAVNRLWKPLWIDGRGSLAVVAFCNQPTVSLHRDPAAAEAALGAIDAYGCGGFCRRDHRLVDMDGLT